MINHHIQSINAYRSLFSLSVLVKKRVFVKIQEFMSKLPLVQENVLRFKADLDLKNNCSQFKNKVVQKG